MKNKIKLVRVDDRLLHATVAVTWSKFVNANFAVIVKEDREVDPFVDEVMRLCLPKSMSVEFTNPSEFQTFMNSDKIVKDDNIMIVFKNLTCVREVVENGYVLKDVQIPYPASRMMIKNLEEYFNLEDLNNIDYLLQQDINIYFQTSPHDGKESNIFKKRKEEKKNV